MPLASSAPEAVFSRLDVGGSAAADAQSAMLEYPPSLVFDLEGARSREAWRRKIVEEDRYVVHRARLLVY